MPESQPGWQDVVLGKFAGLSKTCCCHWLILCKIPNDIYLYSPFGFVVCVCVCLCVYFFLSPSAQALELQLTKKEKKQTNTRLRDRQEPSKNKKDFAPALPSAFRSEQCQASCSKALNPSPPPPDGRSWKMGLENETEPLFRIPLMAESSSALSKHIRLHVGRNLSNCRTDSFSR